MSEKFINISREVTHQICNSIMILNKDSKENKKEKGSERRS
jgi:hypothetical protein